MNIFALAWFVMQLAYVFGAILPIDNKIIENTTVTTGTFIGVDRSDVTFRLYTSQNPTNYTQLFTGNLTAANIDPTKPFKFIIHGFNGNGSLPWVLKMKDEYLKKGDYNVISVDWSKPAQDLYPTAVIYTRDVGKFICEFLVDLINTLSVLTVKIHLIGHSLGAHVAGFTGQNLKNTLIRTIGRITGMDPAGPLFWTNTEDERLSPDDGDYVDVIHTDGGKLGYFPECGHADFYPEAGIAPQPGCATPPIVAWCSHYRCVDLFTESISSSAFVAKQCADFLDYIGRKCDNNTSAIMGENIQLGTEGRFYLSTNSEPPYATNGEIKYHL